MFQGDLILKPRATALQWCDVGQVIRVPKIWLSMFAE